MQGYTQQHLVSDKTSEEKASPVREASCRDLVSRMVIERDIPAELQPQIEEALVNYTEVLVPKEKKEWAELAIGQLLVDARAADECQYSQQKMIE